MRLATLALVTGLALVAGPVASQTVTVTGCSTVAASNVAKSTDKLKLAADIACLDRALPMASDQIAAARRVRQARLDALGTPTPLPTPKPTTTPTPTPTPAPSPAPAAKSIRLFVGDSLSVFWGGNHTGIVAATLPGIDVRSEAVGGTGVANVTGDRLAAILKMRPAEVDIFFGANDLSNASLYPSEADWLADEFKLASVLKANGAAVKIGTVLFQCNAAEHNRRAAIVNAAIRAQAPALFAGVVDYASDPVFSNPAAMCDTNVTSDGVHVWDGTVPGKINGQARLAAIDLGAPLPAPVPSPSPTPDPMPMPMPAPTGGYVASPTLDGAAPFHVAFNIAQGMGPAWGTGAIPGIYATDEGAFRFTCGGEGAPKYDDPVLYPGQPGKSHLHKPWGNTAFDAFTTPASLAASATSNCNATPFSLNRSSYWMPAMLNDQNEVVSPDLVSVYYKRPRSISPYCVQGGAHTAGICIGLPNEIRFIFGWNPAAPMAAVEGASWYCTTGTTLHYDNLDDIFQSGCTVGSQLVADTIAPNCWDGKYLDTPDHRSHMAYREQDGNGNANCDKAHPYLIPQEENKATWTVTADMIGTNPDGTKFSRVRLSSDAMLPAAKPGTTLHADYEEKWVAEAKAIWVANCIEKGLNCSGGDLGNGQGLIGASQPVYGWVNPNPRSPLPTNN